MATSDLVIDTNIFIDHIRSKDKTSTALYRISNETKLYISSVTLYELYMGATSHEKQNDIKKLTRNIVVLPFDEDVAMQAATIYQYLKMSSQLINFRDIFIAATCITYNYPLKTMNRKHFNRIKGVQFA